IVGHSPDAVEELAELAIGDGPLGILADRTACLLDGREGGGLVLEPVEVGAMQGDGWTRPGRPEHGGRGGAGGRAVPAPRRGGGGGRAGRGTPRIGGPATGPPGTSHRRRVPRASGRRAGGSSARWRRPP